MKLYENAKKHETINLQCARTVSMYCIFLGLWPIEIENRRFCNRVVSTVHTFILPKLFQIISCYFIQM